MEAKTRSLPLLPLIAGGALALGLLWFYGNTVAILVNTLATNEDYSFGLLMPLVSGYIIYLKWPQIQSQPWRPSWLGLAIMALGFGLNIFGELLAILYFPPVSFLIVIVGIILLLGGWRMVRLLGFPFLLLFLMVPLPSFIMKSVTLPLQLISSNLAAGFLQLMGIPVMRRGNVIDLGVRQLQVVAACSGLRYILSLLALGIIFCYFYQRRFWKSALLLLSMIPAAIIANALRVMAMGLIPALQEGFWHSFSGWLVFLFCFAILALLNGLLNYLEPSLPAPNIERPQTPAVKGPHGGWGSLTPYLLAALVMVILASPLNYRLSQANPVLLLQGFDNFPLQIGPWQGRRAYLDEAMAKAVGADDYLEANFSNPMDGTLSLWIAFFQSQSKKLEGRIHSPQICLQGSGWNIIESRIVDMAPGKPVRFLLMEQGASQMVVYYWYLQRGRWLASEYSFKLLMGFDGLINRRNDGGIVRLITPATPNVATARNRLASFGDLLVPILPHFIPE